tara:strand:+ start:3599 stop:3796 length:198 start_codon:yes stop_codon:yes gene_type:complete
MLGERANLSEKRGRSIDEIVKRLHPNEEKQSTTLSRLIGNGYILHVEGPDHRLETMAVRFQLPTE